MVIAKYFQALNEVTVFLGMIAKQSSASEVIFPALKTNIWEPGFLYWQPQN